MSHIFISYSHKDSKYVEKLEKKLIEEGFNVWIDHRIDYGTQWPKEIQRQLDSCEAFIVVISENAFESEWVQNEVARAKRKGKPFFPLLLQGDPWLSVEATQYANVTDGSLPPEKFYRRLGKVTPRKKIERTAQHVPTIKSTVKQKPTLPKLSVDPKIAVRVFGTLAVGLIIIWAFPKLLDFIGQIQLPNSKPTMIQGFPVGITDEKGVSMMIAGSGEFIMGSENGDGDEKPVHTVYLDNFYIDRYEVTNAHYKHCVDKGECQPPRESKSNTRPSYYGNSDFDEYPVIYVDWNMAKTYCEWRGSRLPTEAEWENAARGTDGRTYPWGEEIETSKANYVVNNLDTTPVGIFKNGGSIHGVYDMAGNVWEWVADWYDIYPGGDANASAYFGQIYRVQRGGSFGSDGSSVKSFVRSYGDPARSYEDVGFRCARDATP